MNQKHGQRFQELENEITEIISNTHRSGDSEYIKEEDFIEWKVKAKNLLVKSCSEDSEHRFAVRAGRYVKKRDRRWIFYQS